MKSPVSGAVVLWMGLVLGCATASPSQQGAGTSGQDQQKEKAAADAKKALERTLICEDVPVTGSHIPRKVCRTPEQVKKEREESQRTMSTMPRIEQDRR